MKIMYLNFSNDLQLRHNTIKNYLRLLWKNSKRKLIFFMPSMEGESGVEKNLIIIANYISEFI